MRMGDMMWPDSPLTDVDTCDSIVNHCLILYIIYNIYTVAVGWNYCCYCVDSISNKMMWDEMMRYNKCARRKPNREKPRKTSKQVLYGCGVFEVHVHSQFLDLHLFECQIFGLITLVCQAHHDFMLIGWRLNPHGFLYSSVVLQLVSLPRLFCSSRSSFIDFLHLIILCILLYILHWFIYVSLSMTYLQ